MSISELTPTGSTATAGPSTGSLFLDPRGDEPIRAELFGLERLEAQARQLAIYCQDAQVVPGHPLLWSFRHNRKALIEAHRLISEAYRRKEAFGADAEWLLDNFYIVSDALNEIGTDLPSGYNNLLPKITHGPLAGYPRVYALALDLIAHSDSCLDETHINHYVESFQKVAPLTIGELWAIPIMFRLVLVDNMRRLAQHIWRVRADRILAKQWAARKLPSPRAHAAGSEIKFPEPEDSWSHSFIVQLLDLLHDPEAAAPGGVEWLEYCLECRGLSTDEVMRRERQRQAANQVSIGNCVTSLRLLAVLDWAEFFEKNSQVEAILRSDPAQVYAHQDFPTRDRYRKTVEKLARGSRYTESAVARQAVELARLAEATYGATDPRSHVGYDLVDKGLPGLEQLLAYRPRFKDGLRRFVLDHAAALYFGAVALFTLLLIAALVTYAALGGAQITGFVVLLAVVVLLPASEVAVGLTNTLVSYLVKPRVLPKLHFKEGIPPDCATFVVMPTLLVQPGSAAALLERLELHYLSNPDPQLRFALLTDFADAPAEHMPEDESYLRAAVDGVKVLNDRYCKGAAPRFFLCHRRRMWNPVQGCWMGWERKRGKLSEFNRLLRGARDTSYATIAPGFDQLPQIRFVITLDADTQFPREAAQRLVATLAHPLNRPRFDADKKRVVAGYGVIQPRVTLSLTGGRRSWFATIFGGSTGIDPYTTAVSDVYQDLFGLGSYTGKGIYDVDGFEATVGDTFPQNHILSHDLIEGNYARCGLATDVELLDDFPALYPAYARREHRWARGDWQILPWLFPSVPGPHGTRRPNPLNAVERWKIFDNLRRTLVPPALVVLLVLGWTIWSGGAWVWTGAALVTLAWPLFLQLASLPIRSFRSFRDGMGLRRTVIIGALPNTAGQVLLSIAFLPHQALLLTDAIVRTFARLYVTKRNRLEWETAAITERRMGGGLGAFVRNMWPASALALVLTTGLALWSWQMLLTAAPVLLAWLLSPLLAYWVSRPRRQSEPALTPTERAELRLLARKTWGFFETFVTADDNWLPPDNFQEDPKGEVAHRTSPTNIGLYLLSALGAHDFGYVSYTSMIGRLENAFQTFDRLEKSHGHLLNWYDTQSLKPLQPHYLSTVDSGNLLGCLLALKQGIREKAAAAIPGPRVCDGVTDTLDCLLEALRHLEPAPGTAMTNGEADNGADPTALGKHLRDLRRHLCQPTPDLRAWDALLQRLEGASAELLRRVQGIGKFSEEVPEGLLHWTRKLAEQTRDHRTELTTLAPWLEAFRTVPRDLEIDEPGGATAPNGDALQSFGQRWRRVFALLVKPFSLTDYASLAESAGAELSTLVGQAPSPEGRRWLEIVAAAVGRSEAAALLNRCQALVERAEALGRGMDFKVLYNEQRHLFAVGFNLSAGRLDNSHYDLLASEASLTSFLAVARGEVPKKHWFQLGRPMTRAPGSITLLSWGGTMFEYLMPRLLLPSFPGTLLDESQIGAVGRQVQYGRASGAPWGVSESAFSALDLNQNYQYQAFGVPGLGLKRGLSKDLVVAPYATVLAVTVQPRLAAHNLRRLAAEGANGFHGFYEAIDYTTDRLPPKKRSVVVKCYMAHHQGMALIALVNCLLGNPMPRRFRGEPMVRATELLLQERVAEGVPLVDANYDEAAVAHSPQDNVFPVSRRLTTPHTVHPRVHVLSSGRYTVMITNAGAGRSTWTGQDVSRWREDRTCDRWGQFIYVRDLRNDLLWSAGHQPVRREADEYEVIYATDKAEFRRVDAHIETRMEVTVSPETHAEIRRLILTNHDNRAHELELTSYLEVVLGPHGGDLAHPAFGKLFLETEYLPMDAALLCHRRPRSPDQKPVWAVHVLAVDGQRVGDVQCETDRNRFLGRGRTPATPAALARGAVLSGTTGPVLDPVFSLRCRVRVAPETSIGVAFVTAAAETRQEVLALADHYHDFIGVNRGFELAWAHSQVELRHLRLTAQEVHLFLRLAAYVYYAAPALRAPASVLKANRLGQPGLWGHGISGDNPIVLIRIDDADQLGLVRQLLAAHAYWRLKGLVTDLVILNEHQAGYFQDVNREIQELIRNSDDRGMVDKPAGVFVRLASHMGQDDRTLLLAAARCVLVGNRGTLAAQLDRLERMVPASLPVEPARPMPAPQPRRAAPYAPSEARLRRDESRDRTRGPQGKPPSTAARELVFANGAGGFTPDGREYVVQTNATGRGDSASAFPPAPWINVVANPECGFLISEAGAGYTWVGNSQLNRLTPWNNDPVSDRPGEVLYVRDDVTGEIWTPTPLPLPGGPCLVRHGQGYTVFEHSSHGVAHELTLFVPVADPVKLVALKLRNLGREPRRLSATFYAEWVLGTVRDQAPMQVITEVDKETGALLARNVFNADYPTAVAFADVDARTRTVTGDRTEFLGRNGSLARPAALGRPKLSGAAGADYDPCAAVQTAVDLKPGEEKFLVFMLGQAPTVEEVRTLVSRYRDAGNVTAALARVKARWEATLGAVQVRTPNAALDLLLNRWLLYQVQSCRVWGRSALYQSGGAYGFRDQLQDVMALVYAAPQETREQILRSASRQFRAGDVQHWWHPPRGGGVRTRCSDDFLWLPYTVLYYVSATGDTGILDVPAPFLEAPELRPDQEEDYRIPAVTEDTATLYEHCVRALENGLKFGAHGLPLIGTGDWNDGMNRVGREGKGESVWNAWFLLAILPEMAALAIKRGEADRAARYRDEAERLRRAVEEHAWDGGWYRRAYFDDGTPLGSSQNDECKIDSLAQSWAVLSGAGEPEHAHRGLASADEFLVRRQDKVIRLFTPPFDKSKLEPGYVKGYVPGIRENGGQYTHAAAWLIRAAAQLGQGRRAMEWFDLINPILHTNTPEGLERYRTEPYVVAGDVYSEPPHTGRGGWTWYTGSAGWLYRTALETMLGFQPRGVNLRLDPCIPPDWQSFEITYRHRTATYRIRISNPDKVERGVRRIVVDGRVVTTPLIELADDGKEHVVEVTMGAEPRP
jgi:cyclic beta-1,2-glucan synthetase